MLGTLNSIPPKQQKIFIRLNYVDMPAWDVLFIPHFLTTLWDKNRNHMRKTRGNSFFRANFEFIANVLKGKIVSIAQNKMKPLTFSVRGRRMKMRFPSFIAQYRNIFLNEEYAFSFDGSSPRILDIGANFGMSIL